MKYSVNNYVSAFTEVIKKTPQESVVTSFVKLLKKTGDIKSGPKIIEAIHRKLVNSGGGNWVKIETAREISEKKNKELKNNFSKKDHIIFNANPELVAGVRITINGESELDNTLNNKLNKLFK